MVTQSVSPIRWSLWHRPSNRCEFVASQIAGKRATNMQQCWKWRTAMFQTWWGHHVETKFGNIKRGSARGYHLLLSLYITNKKKRNKKKLSLQPALALAAPALLPPLSLGCHHGHIWRPQPSSSITTGVLFPFSFFPVSSCGCSFFYRCRSDGLLLLLPWSAAGCCCRGLVFAYCCCYWCHATAAARVVAGAAAVALLLLLLHDQKRRVERGCTAGRHYARSSHL